MFSTSARRTGESMGDRSSSFAAVTFVRRSSFRTGLSHCSFAAGTAGAQHWQHHSWGHLLSTPATVMMPCGLKENDSTSTQMFGVNAQICGEVSVSFSGQSITRTLTSRPGNLYTPKQRKAVRANHRTVRGCIDWSHDLARKMHVGLGYTTTRYIAILAAAAAAAARRRRPQ